MAHRAPTAGLNAAERRTTVPPSARKACHSFQSDRMLTQRPAGRPIRPRSPRPGSWCVIFGSGSAAEISRVPSVPKRIPAANDSIQRLPDVDAGLDRTRSARRSPRRQARKGRGIRKGSWTSYGEANRRIVGVAWVGICQPCYPPDSSYLCGLRSLREISSAKTAMAFHAA